MVKTGDLLRGRYRIQTLLGAGTMARVYYAFDTQLPTGAGSRDRALKILDPKETAIRHGMSEQEVIDDFKREARILLKINHPHIMRAYDYFEENGLHVLVLEYVVGKTLEEIRTAQRFAESETIELALQILDVIGSLHKANIVYRDLKPGNIVVNTENDITLVDFGTARELGTVVAQGTQIVKGTALGTPGYAAPEQWGGNLDVRSDLYSLGVIMKELLTGKDPEMFDTKPLSGFGPEISRITTKATRLDPAERYQTTQEMKAELLSMKGCTITVPVIVNTPLNNSTRTIQVVWNELLSAVGRDGKQWIDEYANIWLGAIEFEKRGLYAQASSQLKEAVTRYYGGGALGSTNFGHGAAYELLGDEMQAFTFYQKAVSLNPKLTEAFDGIARLDPAIQQQRQQLAQQKAAKRQKVINVFITPVRWMKVIPNLLATFFQLHPRHALHLLTHQKIWLLHVAAVLGIALGIYKNIHIARFDPLSIIALAMGSFLLFVGMLSIGYHIKATSGIKYSYTIFSFFVGIILILLNGQFAPYSSPDWGPRMQAVLVERDRPFNWEYKWGKRAKELDPAGTIRSFHSKNIIVEPHRIQQLLVEERIHIRVKDFHANSVLQREESIKTLNESLSEPEKP